MVLLRLRRPGRTSNSASNLHPELSDEDFVKLAYREVLGRDADIAGLNHYVHSLSKRHRRQDVVRALEDSAEHKLKGLSQQALEAMHASRMEWVRSLPSAGQILDLGGSSTTNPLGALVEMGYPHSFDELVIIDLPPLDRHELYRTEASERVIDSDQGRVRWLLRSMTDLADLPEGSFDLICSGQTFEHVTPIEGEHVLSEAHRLLRPGGRIALDTPNRLVTALQLADSDAEFINPDHKIEYTHEMMLDLFHKYGFVIERQSGLNHVPKSVASGKFELSELTTGARIHPDIAASYMLAYLAHRH